VDARRNVLARMSGRRIVEMAKEDLVMSKILTRAAFENAIRVNAAIGGSTNAVIHLLAIAGRIGVDLKLADWDELGHKLPCLLDLQPSGKHLMEDFYYAGGLPALMNRIRAKLHVDALTVTGKTVGQNIEGAEVYNDDVIRTEETALYHEGALAVLKGNLAPNGCVIKPSACAPRFYRHTGPALVFDSYPAMKEAIDDENLDVTENHVLVLRNAGPQGGPGMPEWGMLPIPTKLVKQGVRDMLRLSDARMSGTSYGACMLHCAPEAYIGGPLALVKTGDRISVDVPARRIHLEVSDQELAARRAAWVPAPKRYERGYGWMFSRHILQADQGCDFDYLETDFGAPVPEPDIF
jgi:dihydroxy-acid dehydratase